MTDDTSTQNALQNVIAQAQKADGGTDALPPVHLWEPDYCGDIGLRIARDGQWYYAGSPIGRKRLVRLFSTILRHAMVNEMSREYVNPDQFRRLQVQTEKLTLEVESLKDKVKKSNSKLELIASEASKELPYLEVVRNNRWLGGRSTKLTNDQSRKQKLGR